MPVSDHFIEYVLDQLSGWGDVSARKMFGGAGLYRDDKMFGLIADDVAYLKVDNTNRAQYQQAGSEPFRPFPHKPTLMPYYDVPAHILEQPELFIAWARQSLVIAQKRK